MPHRFRLIVLCAMAAATLIVSVAEASRAPTAGESAAITRAALRALHEPGSRVSHIRVSTVPSRYGYAKAAVQHGTNGPGGEMILRYRNGGWSELFLGQSEFCTANAPLAVLKDLGFACRYKPRLRIVPGAVAVGAKLAFVGSGFRPRTPVWLGVGPPQSEATKVGFARTDGKGSFRRVFRASPSWVRPSIRPGHYAALACQLGCRIKTGANFRILTGRG